MVISRRGFISGGSAVAAAAIIAPGRGARASTSMAISCGKVEITPEIEAGADPQRPFNPYMAGYARDGRRSAGRGEPLYARCTVFWDDGHPNVIVTADVLGFGAGMHRQIRDGVVALGVPSADFMLTATHTHHGPVLTERLDPYISYGLAGAQLDVVRGYSDWLAARIVDLVDRTLKTTPRPCTLDHRVTTAGFAYNRIGWKGPGTSPFPYTETEVPVLVARAANGDPLAILFSYGCHPICSRSDSFDPDYPRPGGRGPRGENRSVRALRPRPGR